MNGDTLGTLLDVAVIVLLALTFLVSMIAVCLPAAKRSAILRYLRRRWII